jgi:hypothetical protein
MVWQPSAWVWDRAKPRSWNGLETDPPKKEGKNMPSSPWRLLIKVIAFQLVFLILHYSYEWFPNGFTRIFSAIDESVYQHMKVAFFSYIPVILGEYLLRRKSITSLSQFSYARIFSLVLLPLIMIIYFMAAPAFVVKIESIPLEIIFANLALIATSLSAFLIEEHFENTEITRAVKIVLIVLLILSFSEFLIFTERLPWCDIFANPPGW